ncbi:NAD(P)/FAD-dependent oxidoreductase [Microvirga sp. 17 mud 1-3]|uniref:NAD(P)/FAD-dependent oxidoreductase n=1 Tax=Microvirga sp. 17 mud 1-3 TaxID=2082949 RepID=UPI000D6B2D31|nr:NAD(P)/FAD-dependent oxidoreductase [Microvirga sp. 17 mud 1-3]AWM88689.1 FAD-dependent oxidoreductase [Microvirga sp. 17 mud 1-3]
MDILVVGAGVVGLAVARALALRGHDVIVAEATGGIGNGVSSRNSEVIHGGMYYPSGSLRARHCVAGRRMLYEFCESHGVPHRKCGKLIVATNALEQAKIEGIYEQGIANGVEGLSFLSGNDAKALEPNLSCTGAVLSRETGIIDSHALMLALQGDLEAAGGMVAFHAPVERIARTRSGWEVQTGGAEPAALPVDAVVNAAGLGAQGLARATEDYPAERVPPLVLAKGNYFGCLGRPAFSRLVYPAPVDGGLGTHVTLDLAGRMRFGPDVEWIEREVYEVDPARAESFYASIRRYWPGLPDGALVPDYAGIRPKLTGPGEPPADFLIDGPTEHGLPGLVQLFGIESPGLTSSLSIADDVARRLSN